MLIAMKLFLIIICLFAPVYGNSIHVTIENGKLEGTTYTLPNGRIVYAFFGIPFAAPPVGHNRFEPPLPAATWKGIRNATYPRNACVQFLTIPGIDLIGDEDCLYLNIFVPKLPKKKKNTTPLMNVMVYIHGGAFVFGSGISIFPDHILQFDDIVFVTINYRLGPLGFFSTQDFVAPGNNALKDQVAALRWVQQNIHNFEGDSSKVTIYGVSAGGASAHYHMISPLSRGLFHNGISASGSVLNPWAYIPQTPENSYKLASFSSCPTGNTRLMLRCLKRKSIGKIYEAYQYLSNSVFKEKKRSDDGKPRENGGDDFKSIFRLALFFGPVIEPKSPLAFITRHPYNLLKNKKVKDLPWMISVVEKEGTIPGIVMVTNDEFLKTLNDKWHKKAPSLLFYDYLNSLSKRDYVGSEVRQFYFGDKPISNQTTNELLQILGDRLFYNGIAEAAKLHTSAVNENTYCYKFNYRGTESICDELIFSNETRETEQNYGTCHTDDQYYLVKFMPGKVKKNRQDQYMAEFMTSSIIAFMKNGNPNTGALDWRPISKNNSLDCLNIYSPSLQKMENIENSRSSQFWKDLLPPSMEYWEDPRKV